MSKKYEKAADEWQSKSTSVTFSKPAGFMDKVSGLGSAAGLVVSGTKYAAGPSQLGAAGLVAAVSGVGGTSQKDSVRASNGALDTFGRRVGRSLFEEAKAAGCEKQLVAAVKSGAGFWQLRRPRKDDHPLVREAHAHVRRIANSGAMNNVIAKGIAAEIQERSAKVPSSTVGIAADRVVVPLTAPAPPAVSFPASESTNGLVKKTVSRGTWAQGKATQVGRSLRESLTKTANRELGMAAGLLVLTGVKTYLGMEHGPDAASVLDHLEGARAILAQHLGFLNPYSLDNLVVLAVTGGLSAMGQGNSFVSATAEKRGGPGMYDWMVKHATNDPADQKAAADEQRGFEDAKEGEAVDEEENKAYKNGHSFRGHFAQLGRQGRNMIAALERKYTQPPEVPGVVAGPSGSPDLPPGAPSTVAGGSGGGGSAEPASGSTNRASTGGGGGSTGQVNADPVALEGVVRALQNFLEGVEEAQGKIHSTRDEAGETWQDWFFDEVSRDIEELLNLGTLAESVGDLISRINSKIDSLEAYFNA